MDLKWMFPPCGYYESVTEWEDERLKGEHMNKRRLMHLLQKLFRALEMRRKKR